MKIIIACDCDLATLKKIIYATAGNPGVYGYKIGASLALRHGLRRVCNAREAFGAKGKKVIYDHQKAGTDVPHTGKDFAKVLADGGVDEAILFPHAGPKTLIAWSEALADQGLDVIVGGHMTHEDYTGERGYIKESSALYRVLIDAAQQAGVRRFVVPGNQPQVVATILDKVFNPRLQTPVTDQYGRVLRWKESKKRSGMRPCWDYTFYSPGFKMQGGSILEMNAVMGAAPWYPIVGRAIYEADDPGDAVDRLLEGVDDSVSSNSSISQVMEKR